MSGSPIDSPSFAIIVIYSLVVALIIPFLVGFFISFFILKRVFIDKKSKKYPINKNIHILIILLVSGLFGWLTVIFLGNYFGDIGNYVIEFTSK